MAAALRKRDLMILTRAGISIAVLGVSVAVLYLLLVTQPRFEPAAGRTDPPAVQVMRPAWVEVHRQHQGYGTAAAKRTADIPAQVTAIVIERPPETVAGATVVEGQVLLALDATDLQQSLARITQQLAQMDALIEQNDLEQVAVGTRVALAEEEAAIARRDLERVRTLYDQGDAREVELDQAIQRARQAERTAASVKWELDRLGPRRLELDAQRAGLDAERRLAERNVERTVIRSPIAGVLESVDVEVGEQTSPGRRVARVVDLSRIEVPVRIPVSSRDQVGIGDEVALRPAGGSQMQWSGRVLRLGPVADDLTRTFPVYIEVIQRPDTRTLLMPGMFVHAMITSTQTQQRMVIPRRAINDRRVLLVLDGRVDTFGVDVDYFVQRRFEETGLAGENYWAVLVDPIPDAALVVLNGSADLTRGELVRAVIMNERASALGMREE